MEQNKLLDLKILHLDNDSKLKEKIVAKSANVKTNNWILSEVIIFEKDFYYEKKNGRYFRNKLDL